jgi:hypothetical protein
VVRTSLHRDPILASLPIPDRDGGFGKIHIFDAQTQALEEPEAGPVQ